VKFPLLNLDDLTRFAFLLQDGILNFQWVHKHNTQTDMIGQLKNLIVPTKLTLYLDKIDKIHPFLLFSAVLQIFKPLTYIINLTLEQGIFPTSLKIAKVIPIFKQGSCSSCMQQLPAHISPISVK